MTGADLAAKLKHVEGMIIGIKRRYGTKWWEWPQIVKDRYDGLRERAKLIRARMEEQGDGDIVRGDNGAGQMGVREPGGGDAP